MALSDKVLRALRTGLADTDLGTEAASIAEADVASFSGQVAGMTTDVTIEADVAGSAGNITLTADSITDIDGLIAAHNGANPSNTVTLTSGDGSQVPTANIVLSGGEGTAAAASDELLRNLTIALASKSAAEEVVAALEAGSTALSDDAKRRIKIMMADNAAADELISEIED